MSEKAPSVIPATDVPSYKLPLSPVALERAFQRGHGRAYLHAIEYDTPDDLLVHALTHNLRFDKQCEDAAQDWYLSMASRHPRASSIFEQVVARASDTGCSDYKNYLAGTLANLHRHGYQQALPALYSLTSAPDKEYSPPVPGGSELIEIEGERGLIHVLRTLASATSETQIDPWMIQCFFGNYTENFREDCVDKLAAMAADDSVFKPLLDTMLGLHPSVGIEGHRGTVSTEATLESLTKLSNDQLQSTPASLLIDLVRSAPDDGFGYAVRRWARLAPRDALDEIISEALSEKDPHRVHKYLRAFTERSPLHRYDTRFAALLDHPLDKLRWTAHHALATCPDPRVRELALGRLSREKVAWGSIGLFQSTYQPGDHRAIETALYLPVDTETTHNISFSVLDVFGQNTTPESLSSMLFVYEHGPCMNCRGRAIKVMQSAGVLPAWVLEESRFDADSTIRECVSGSEAIPGSAH